MFELYNLVRAAHAVLFASEMMRMDRMSESSQQVYILRAPLTI